MTTSTFDALTAARALKAAGIEAEQAEAIAAQLRVAAVVDHDELATKADIASVRADLDAGLASVRADLDAGIASVRGEVNALRVELRIIGALVLAMAAKLFGIFDAVAGMLA